MRTTVKYHMRSGSVIIEECDSEEAAITRADRIVKGIEFTVGSRLILELSSDTPTMLRVSDIEYITVE